MLKKLLIFLIIISKFSFSDNNINIVDKYNSFNFNNKLEYEIFEKAYLGYLQISEKTSELLAIIDYSKPSSDERFFLLDLANNKVLYNTRIAHSKNSGFDIPIKFSNDPNSFENSLGFYLTLEEYNGAYGTSLRLKGLEENINSNAEERAIVIHGGNIADDSYFEKYGFLGRSLGCPVLPTNIIANVVSLIKNGTVVFINGNDDSYMEESKFMKKLSSFNLKLTNIPNL
ncbi:murein L,D-transpeptidase catalytic domain family protein [Fusobacterium sp.]|uniref:murein L,D-transpeptidase catalytic domain family protein n=1 Tax=Fusobacterium sp. TaxID=68766 RepID=UPI0034C5D41B